MNELICTDLVVDKQIKDTFRIYYQRLGSDPIDYFGVHLIPLGEYHSYKEKVIARKNYRKWNYVYTVQKNRVKDCGMSTDTQIFHMALSKVISLLPKRYQPEDVEVKWVGLGNAINVKHRALVFREQSISYLMQKYPPEELMYDPWKRWYVTEITLGMMIDFFKSICEHTKGLEFEEYIDDWAKRLTEEI